MSVPEGARIITVTADDFEVQWDAEHTFPFFEDENGDGVYGYGHHDKEGFARQLNEFDELCTGGPSEDEYTADQVAHDWAVAYIKPGDPDDYWMTTWHDVTEETPGAFPMTRVMR